MSRWEPNARGRLEEAAYALFLERGYEHTTVAEIAERAGLTERTFFRYFSDKREVLFSGAAALQDDLVRTVAEVPPGAPAIEAVRIGVEAAALRFHGQRAAARERRLIVAAHADLQERELIKRAALTRALAQALHERGIGEPTASLVADVGIAVLFVAFAHWIEDAAEHELVEVVRDGFERLEAATRGA